MTPGIGLCRQRKKTNKNCGRCERTCCYATLTDINLPMLSTSLNVSSRACPTWSRWWMRLSTAESRDMVSLTEADGRSDTGTVHSCLQLVFFSFAPDVEFWHWTDARCTALFARMLTRWHSIFSRLSKFGRECSDCWLCVMHDPSPVWVSQRMRSAILVMTMEAVVYTRSVCHCWKSQRCTWSRTAGCFTEVGCWLQDLTVTPQM